MAEERAQRRLAAIISADIVGYSKMMGQDEVGTLARLKSLRSEFLHPKIAEFGGRIVKTTGDGTLIEFGSAVDAVSHAIEVQQGIAKRNATIPDEQKFHLRLGVNVGDILIEGDDIFGDGVNVAARLEAMAEPGGIYISARVHDYVGDRLNIAYDDLGAQRLKNITEPVHVYRIRIDGSSDPDSPTPMRTGPVGERPSIAVLPFDNLSNDPDQEFFADGLTEDLITALSYWRTFPVIARNSTFAYKGKSPDIREVAKHLGVRYVLEGSVRKAGDRVRVTAQLIDGETGNHIWAEKYDRRLEDFFDLQDEITQIIAAKVEPEFAKAEQKRAEQKHPNNMDAWECYQRGVASLNEMTREGNIRAREYYTRAIEMDPASSRAYSGMAYALFRYSYDGYSGERGLANEESVEFAKRAVALDDGDAQAHEMLSILLLHSGNHEASTAEARRAVELNPNNAHAHIPLGNSRNFAGSPEDGISFLETAIRLNPDDSRGHFYLSILAEAHLNNRDYGQAVEISRKTIDRKRDFPHPYCTLASALGHLGKLDDANTALAECLRLQPDYVEDHPQLEWYKEPADKEHILDGLRLAGWKG